jgi:hypothetical protein
MASFLNDERGELAPASYLLTLPVALWFIFFTIDLGLRKGALLGVQYAAFCAARAAAVNLPPSGPGGCNTSTATQAATRAAAACLAGFASKRGLPDPTVRGAVSQLVDRAQQQVTVTLEGGCSKSGVVTATVRYRYLLQLPLSPLSSRTGGSLMTASAQYLIY